MNISCTKTILSEGKYEMELSDTKTSDVPQLVLCEAPYSVSPMSKMISLGTIDKNLVSEEVSPILREINFNGQSLLQIEIAEGNQGKTKKIIIECDPALGYRFRRIERYHNEKLIREIIADDYRDANGTPYPFLYVDRRFDMDGKIVTESKCTFEKAELGVDLSQKDFKILVPSNTVITDTILGMESSNIEKDERIGIADVLNIGAQKLATDELAKLISQSTPQISQNKEIFIPNAYIAQKDGKAFIFDLATGRFIDASPKGNLDTKDAYTLLTKLGKGDIAWDGSLVILRGATASVVKQETEQPFESEVTDWVSFCKLPEKVKLPYNLIVNRKEGNNYLLTLQKIESDGVFITYKWLQ